MTKSKKLKRRVRAKAGGADMSYTAARRALLGTAPKKPAPADFHERYKRNRFEFRENSLQSWRSVVGSFGSTRIWRDPGHIAEVLSTIANTALTNHVHFPDGGGLDLSGASSDTEPGCVRLAFQGGSSYAIARPDALRLEVFDDDPLGEWSYFRLDLAALEPTGIDDAFRNIKEDLTELGPGRYASYDLYFREDDPDEDGVGDEDDDDSGTRSPRRGRPVTRYLRGAFLIVAKASSYNAIPGTYDGRHSQVGAVEFHDDIARTVAELRARDLYGIDPSTGSKHWPRADR